MTMVDLRAARNAEPFRPFAIRMNAGESFTVSDPERIALAPEGEDAVVFGDSGQVHLIDVALVSEIVTLSTPEDKSMTVENLRAFKRARPFRRFAIRTSSGESYLIRHPEFIAFTYDRKGVLVVPGPGRVALIDLANIAELTYDLTQRPGPSRPRDDDEPDITA